MSPTMEAIHLCADHNNSTADRLFGRAAARSSSSFLWSLRWMTRTSYPQFGHGELVLRSHEGRVHCGLRSAISTLVLRNEHDPFPPSLRPVFKGFQFVRTQFQHNPFCFALNQASSGASRVTIVGVDGGPAGVGLDKGYVGSLITRLVLSKQYGYRCSRTVLESRRAYPTRYTHYFLLVLDNCSSRRMSLVMFYTILRAYY